MKIISEEEKKKENKTEKKIEQLVELFRYCHILQSSESTIHWVVIRTINLDWAPDGHYPLESLQLTSIAALFLFYFYFYSYLLFQLQISAISLYLLEPMAEATMIVEVHPLGFGSTICQSLLKSTGPLWDNFGLLLALVDYWEHDWSYNSLMIRNSNQTF